MTADTPKELGRAKSLLLSIFIAVLVGLGTVPLGNYIAPFTGGARETADLLLGLTFFVFAIAFLVAFNTRPSTRKVARLGGVGTVIILLYIASLVFQGVPLPDEAKQALENHAQDADYSLDYVWLGKYDLMRGTTYCVIIDPPLADGVNAFVLQRSGATYGIVSPEREDWLDLGCGHLDDVTNPDF
jgi:hypothetical protein